MAAALSVLPPAAAVRSPAARFQVGAAARHSPKYRVILQADRIANRCSAERSSACGGCSVACGSLPGGSRCAAYYLRV